MRGKAFQSPWAILALALASVTFLAAAEPVRPLPFNKNNVYAYFRKVDELKREMSKKLKTPKRDTVLCHIYADALNRSGYSFNATVTEAVTKINQFNMNMDNPRYAFLAGTFQVHPDLFLKEKLITKENRDAVVKLFSQGP